MAMLGLHKRQTGYEPDRFEAFQAPPHREQNSECRALPEIQWQSTQPPTDLIRRGTVVAGKALKLGRILVPFDFSSASVRLLQRIASIPLNPETRVWVLHVVHPAVPDIGQAARFQSDANLDRMDAARLLLSRLLHDLRPGPNLFEAQVRVGRLTDEIVGFARSGEMDLIVMTAHGERTRQHLRVSATTERVVRRSFCPVLILPEAFLLRNEPYGRGLVTGCKRILVPTDLSPGSAAALRCAAAIAREQNAALYVLNFSGAGHSGSMDWAARHRLERWLEAHLDSGAEVQPIVRSGKPSVYMLLRQAVRLEADLLVFSPRCYSQTERLRLSSSTDAILRHAHCPVLSVRPDTLNAGL